MSSLSHDHRSSRQPLSPVSHSPFSHLSLSLSSESLSLLMNLSSSQFRPLSSLSLTPTSSLTTAGFCKTNSDEKSEDYKFSNIWFSWVSDCVFWLRRWVVVLGWDDELWNRLLDCPVLVVPSPSRRLLSSKEGQGRRESGEREKGRRTRKEKRGLYMLQNCPLPFVVGQNCPQFNY